MNFTLESLKCHGPDSTPFPKIGCSLEKSNFSLWGFMRIPVHPQKGCVSQPGASHGSMTVMELQGNAWLPYCLTSIIPSTPGVWARNTPFLHPPPPVWKCSRLTKVHYVQRTPTHRPEAKDAKNVAVEDTGAWLVRDERVYHWVREMRV
jgi:hypothetical protein